MKIAIPKEKRSGEARVAASPDSVKKLVALGASVTVEKSAGAAASFADERYKDAGASIATSYKTCVKDADVVLKVQGPDVKTEVAELKAGTVLIAQLNASTDKALVAALAKAGVTAFAMELLPRITRAQSMDVLSSQANLAGYRAVIDGAAEFGRALPMMMTAAGTIAPAKVFIMGVGVAGLQAIATAKRLGAVVTATDVRPATKEQVASLGGKFLSVDAEMEKEAETAGGYAKEMPLEYYDKQKQVVAEHITKQDIVITTALIPGRQAPVLVTEDMVKTMKPGSVIVDLAVSAGGNCPLSELDKVVVKHGVKLIGHSNLPSRLAADASSLYAKNLLNFITPMIDAESKALAINWEDELITGTLVTREGAVVHPSLTSEGK